MYGEIREVRDDDDVIVRIAPELDVRVARRAIAGVVDRPKPRSERRGPGGARADRSDARARKARLPFPNP